MPEDANAAVVQPEPTEPEGQAAEPAAQGAGRTWTQAEVDAYAKRRIDKQNAKHAAELADAQAALAEAKAAAEAAAAEAEGLKRAAARGRAVAEAAKEHGVDAEILARMAGDTPEEIADNAQALAAKVRAMPLYPATVDQAVVEAPKPSREAIAAIGNREERIAAIAGNLSLYQQ